MIAIYCNHVASLVVNQEIIPLVEFAVFEFYMTT